MGDVPGKEKEVKEEEEVPTSEGAGFRGDGEVADKEEEEETMVHDEEVEVEGEGDEVGKKAKTKLDSEADIAEASSNSDITAPTPTGPPLKPVVISVNSVTADGKVVMKGKVAIELRLLRGKKIRVVFIRDSATSGMHHRLQLRFDFHHVTAVKVETSAEETTTLTFDVCLAPDFLWNVTKSGSKGWEKNAPDFTEGAVATRGRRWSFIFDKSKVEQATAMLRSCQRLRKLLTAEKFPQEAKDYAERGRDVYSDNKDESMPGTKGLPIITDPLTVAKELQRLRETPPSDFDFRCFKCLTTFTMQDVLDNQQHFEHWYSQTQTRVHVFA